MQGTARYRVLICLVALAGLVALNVARAGAASSDKLTIHFDPEGGAFFGEIKSEEASCLADRKITMYKTRKGPDKPGRTTVTDADGSWGITRDRVASGARYYVKTPKEAVSQSLTCSALTSKYLTTPG